MPIFGAMYKPIYILLLLSLASACSPNEKELLGEARKLLNESNPTEALTYLDRAINKNPQSFDGYNMKGTAYFILEDYESALKDWQIALLIDSTSYKPFYNMGNALRKLKSYEEAIVKYSRAINLKPNEKDLYINRGSTLYDLQHFEGALNDFKFAIELDNRNVAAHINIGKTLIRIFNLDEAKVYL